MQRTRPISSRQWRAHFERNAAALLPVPWEAKVAPAPAERLALARSVATFQIGETGGGTRLIAAAERYAKASGDDDYLAAIRLFVAEEQRHGSELARWLDAAGLPRIKRHWTNVIFRRARNVAGLELMISTLLAAEVMAKVYYAALRKASGCRVLRRLCEQILKDEVAHIRFQTERLAILRRRRAWPALVVTHAFHHALFAATTLIVWWTHRTVLRVAGLGLAGFWSRVRHEVRVAMDQMDPRRYVPPAVSDRGFGQAARG